MIKEFAFKIKVQTAEGVAEVTKAITSLEGFDKRITELNKQIRATDFGSAQFKELNTELARTRQAKQEVVDAASAQAAAFNNSTAAVQANTQAENDNTQSTEQNAQAQKKTGAAVEGNTSAFQRYQLQIRKARVAFQEAFATGDEKAMKKYRAEIDDLEDSLEIATLKSMKFGDAMASLPGVAGFVGQSIQGVEKGFKVLAANPLVATFTLLATLATALFGAFSKTEKGAKSLSKVGEFLERVFNGIVAVLQPLFDWLSETITAVLESETAMKILGATVGGVAATFKGLWLLIKGFVLTLVDLWTSVYEVGKALGGLGESIGKFFKGDFSGAADSAKKVFNAIGDVGTKFIDGVSKRAKEGVQEVADTYTSASASFTKGFGKALKKDTENAAKALDELKKQVEDYVKGAEDTKEKTRERELAAEDNLYKTLRDKAKGNNELLAKIEEAHRIRVNAINKTWDEKDAADLDKKQKENFEKVKKHLDDIANTTRSKTAVASKTEQQDLKKQLLDKGITEEQYQMRTLQLNSKFAQQKIEDEQKLFANSQAQLLSQRALGLISESDYQNQRLELEKNYNTTDTQLKLEKADADIAVKEYQFGKEKQLEEAMVKVQADATQAKIDLEMATLEAVGFIGSLLGQFAGENKDLQKAAIIIEQGAAIGKILVGASSSIAQQTSAALAQGALVGGPVLNPVGYATVMASLAKGISATKIGASIGVATAIAGAARGISDIDKANVGGGGQTQQAESPRRLASGGMVSGAGNGMSDSIPAMLSNGESVINASSTAMFSPLLSMINQAGGGAPFNIGGNNTSLQITSEQTPIKTYVVASDMTNMQMFDRAQQMRSTI